MRKWLKFSGVVASFQKFSGQKVKVLWGETRKEYTAVVECYPVAKTHVSKPTEKDTELPQRRAKAKRKLVSKIVYL